LVLLIKYLNITFYKQLARAAPVWCTSSFVATADLCNM